MKWNNYIILLVFLPFLSNAQDKMEPLSFSEVKLQDKFWKPRADQVNKVTIPVCIEYTENKTGRIRNFQRAGGILKDNLKHEGIYYDDSDVYKALEAIAYSLKTNPNPVLESKADDWISSIAAAQEPDGYLNTYFSLTALDQRWTDMTKHEDYCAGHLIEAGIAYYYATGKRKLLDVGIKMADHMNEVFGSGKRHWVTGHQEVELALIKLFKTTKEKKYLQLAEWFLHERGRGHGSGFIWSDKKWGAAYCQDDVTVSQISNIQGHAVRAMYYYAAIADVSSLIGNQDYLNAMKRVWEDVVYRNVYLTGAIGSSRLNEGFTKDYDLPNFDAYGETCASVGMVFWNQRMNLLTGEAKYIDVLERSLYNGALAGLSLEGDQFFYPNPLASYGGYERRPWFGTACCPSNIARLLASVGDYIYTYDSNSISLNLFVGSEANIKLLGNTIKLIQETNYPSDGLVKIKVEPQKKSQFSIHIRIPGWTNREVLAGGLYSFDDQQQAAATIKVNGKKIDFAIEKGYAVIDRNWKKGDLIELELPMKIRRIVASDLVQQDKGKVAIQRGPIVYCLEGIDNQQQVFNMLLSNEPSTMQLQWEPNLLGGVNTITGMAKVIRSSADGKEISFKEEPFKAIPYYAWANRGGGQMQVWMPGKITTVTLNKE